MTKLSKILISTIIVVAVFLSLSVGVFAEDIAFFGTPDNTPPVLKSISLDKTSVEAPGVITITADVTDDISGAQNINFKFLNKENGREIHGILFYNEETGKFDQYNYNEISISQFEPTGIFELQYMSVHDKAGNSQTYYTRIQERLSENEKYLPQEVSFMVKNEDGLDYITNTNNPNLADDIANQPDGAQIGINYGTASPTLPADVFDAIKDTNKTILLEGDGIQWEFNGKDIVNGSKPINLDVKIEKITGTQTDNAASIDKIVADTPTIVLSFAENGELPGKAKIRLKADYMFREYIGKQNIYIYYFDNVTKKLVPIALNLTVIDGYVEFEITHNSDYIVTKGAISNSKPTGPIYYPSGESSKEKGAITVKQAEGGSIVEKSGNEEEKVFSIVPDEGYKIENVRLDNTSFGAVEEIRVALKEEDQVLTAVFVKNNSVDTPTPVPQTGDKAPLFAINLLLLGGMALILTKSVIPIRKRY